MLTLPPYITLAVPIWLVPFMVLVVVMPLNAWWEPFAPTQYAAFALREASFIPLARAGDNGCRFGEMRAWLRLQRHPEGHIWLRQVLEAHPTPAGRALTLAGLARSGTAGAPWPQEWSDTDSLRVLADSGWLWWTPPEVRNHLATGALAEQLATAGPCPQWGLN